MSGGWGVGKAHLLIFFQLLLWIDAVIILPEPHLEPHNPATTSARERGPGAFIFSPCPLSHTLGYSRERQRRQSGTRPVSVTMKRKRQTEKAWPQADLPQGCTKPRLVVFDLDNTLWSPELYQLKRTPKAERDIWLFDDARAALHELATESLKWGGTQVALASRTNQVEWARMLTTKFEVMPGISIDELAAYKEIFPGSKRKHFQNLKRDSGVPFSDMIFFDDSTMNTREIEMMGILCVHCPRGLTFQHWETGLREFARMKDEEGLEFMGATVSVSSSQKRQRSTK